MAGKSTIEWTQVTWNPVTGCKNCYDERMARRLRLMGSKRYVNEFAVLPCMKTCQLDFPKTLRAPRQIFVNSINDLFQEEPPSIKMVHLTARVHVPNFNPTIICAWLHYSGFAEFSAKLKTKIGSGLKTCYSFLGLKPQQFQLPLRTFYRWGGGKRD